jgi:hypothetical protein
VYNLHQQIKNNTDSTDVIENDYMTLLLTIISIETFRKAVYLHLGLYCGVDVTLVANEVNKFGQIFPIHRRRKYKDIG